MKKYLILAAAIVLICGCKKEETTENVMQPKNMPVQGINIVNGMLSFDKAEFYDTFGSQSDGQVLDALRQYEERNDYLSLAEQREWAEDTVYTEVISSLLNTNYMIHIENKVYRINAHTGYVFTLPAQYINDNAAITALRNEDLGDDRISRHSVEEDLWEISGLPMPKSGDKSTCPTISPGLKIHDPVNFIQPNYSTWLGCTVGNDQGNFTLWNYPRYYRYGIRFELVLRSRETDIPSLAPNITLTCNSIIGESLNLQYRRNGNPGIISKGFESKVSHQGHKSEVVLKPYGGSRRLCAFFWQTRTRRPAINRQTAISTLQFNW